MTFVIGFTIFVLGFWFLGWLAGKINDASDRFEREDPECQRKEAEARRLVEEIEEAEKQRIEAWEKEHPKTVAVAKTVGVGIGGAGVALIGTGYAVGKTAQVASKGLLLVGVGAFCVVAPVATGIWYGLFGRD